MQHAISTDGTRIAYERTGSGPPLLLVHGTTSDHTRWGNILPEFERHFTVYAMDRRGRGESGDAGEYHIMREAGDVAAVVDDIGGSVIVLGHSYGALCALEGALLTDNVDRMVLYEPVIPTGTPLYAPDAPDRLQALVDNGDLEGALEMFLREVVGMPDDDFEAFRSSPMWKARVPIVPTIPRELVFEESYSFEPERFADLAVPTLFLRGGNSPAKFRDATTEVDAALQNSAIVELPGQGHLAMNTAPELFVAEVLRYLLE